MGCYVAVRPSVRRRFSSGPNKKHPEWNPHALGGCLALPRALLCVPADDRMAVEQSKLLVAEFMLTVPMCFPFHRGRHPPGVYAST